ncbi:hypothetical protein BC351_12910 [Paenibacillus ferrarius]|uniref:DNA-binding response regulator n=1 Tax=Paenibacillus ferrarius TaxID=1469647 RepID=A0A1V4H6S1_9BACL|nr:response regulator [Paenibacillus ferrarius]OPH46834.1 hypothetical protein BC351_12910 [Paenibacillus ferrarius]
MIKVLVVDDEKIMRIGLKMMIPWEQHGYEWIGAADDGEAALAMVKQHDPDILITDLQMPKINGLELIQKLREIAHFQGKIIVLSNHGEYNLVREAMKLGALDYLLKVTLKPDDLLDILKKAASELSSEKEDKEIQRQKAVAQVENLMLARKNFFRELVYDNYLSERETMMQAQKLHIQIDSEQSFLLYITIDAYDKTMGSGKWTNRQSLNFSICNIISELVSDSFFMEFSEISDRDYFAILPNHRKYDSDAGKLQLAKRITEMLQLYLNLVVNVVISNPFAGLLQVREAYLACKCAAGLRFYKHHSLVFHAREAAFNTGKAILPSQLEEMRKHIQLGAMEGLIDCLDDIYQYAEERCVHPAQFQKTIVALIDEWESASAQHEYHVLPEQDRKQLEKAENFSDFRSAFVQAVGYFRQYAIPSSPKYRKEIRTVIEFMLKHMDQKITLGMIANEVNMNESYLARLFKTETGRTIVNFLNELRMEKAKELLKNPDLSVKSVSELIGISDQFYFNRLFNKTYGTNPTEFKKSHFRSQDRP